MPVNVTRGSVAFWQTVAVPLMVAVGNGRTKTVTVAESLQPFAAVAVTVNVEVLSGLTVTSFPDNEPGFHDKLSELKTCKIELLPWQTVSGEAEAETRGRMVSFAM